MSDIEDDLDGPLPSHRGQARRREPRDNAGQFDIDRSWELVSEGVDGTLNTSIEALLESSKRKRLLRDTTPLQRGIIRHLIIILDMSVAMNDKDYRPTRYILSLQYLATFINEFFEQNPISQLGIIGMHDGIAIPVSDMSGNPSTHLSAIQKIRPTAQQGRPGIEPKGNPSLENALEMARAALFHAPSHGTREILLIFGALHTSDPGDIHATINSLIQAQIRASVIGLAAQVAICAELVSRTNPPTATHYAIALHEQHYRELLLSHTTPPITYSTPDARSHHPNTLLTMGFPSRTVSGYPTLCACHTRPSRSGYLCSRCATKVCNLPSECPVCGLTLILSTHLARSYHHLFPLVNWHEVPPHDAWRSKSCFGCLKPFPPADPSSPEQLNSNSNPSKSRQITQQSSPLSSSQQQQQQLQQKPTSRYSCPTCTRHFCIDCDLFAHEVVHNCPGCQSERMETSLMGETEISAATHALHEHTINEVGSSVRRGENGSGFGSVVA